MMNAWLALVVSMLTSVFFQEPARAEAFPQRSIVIVVPFSPGTGIDILARTIARELSDRWRKTVVVENRPGASGTIGTQHVARSSADGYTLLMTSNAHTINAAYFRALPFDGRTSFTPLSKIAVGSFLLVTHIKVPANDLFEFVTYARMNPGKLNFASPGKMSAHHLFMELFKLSAKIDMVHVPSSSTSGALQDLLSGNVEAMFLPVHVGWPLVQAGQLRALALGSETRSPLAPGVPTLSELGVGDVNVDLWYALLAPSGISGDLIKQYGAVMSDILQLDRTHSTLSSQGLYVDGSSSEVLAELIDKDLRRWTQVIQTMGLREH
jgi:tripartite-type tricarboxylate transporter receptor subunit TctC